MINNNFNEINHTKTIISRIIPNIYIDKELSPSNFLMKYWEVYKKLYNSNQNINGKVFEELIAICLIREKILPFYMQAKVAFIPYVNYDFIIYSDNIGPISLSAKTSLRERWKQADLEAVALKYIHRKSKTFVLTLDTDAVRRRRVDDSQILGIDKFVLCNTEEFNSTLADIKKNKICLSPKVEVVSSNTIITSENCNKRFII